LGVGGRGWERRDKGGNEEIEKNDKGWREEGEEKQFDNQRAKKGGKELDAQKFLEEEVEIKEGIKEVHIAGGEGKEVVIIQMDSWEKKEEIMRRKKKLGSRRIYIDNLRKKEACKETEGNSKRRESDWKKNKDII